MNADPDPQPWIKQSSGPDPTTQMIADQDPQPWIKQREFYLLYLVRTGFVRFRQVVETD
jgi:hypothetical protein